MRVLDVASGAVVRASTPHSGYVMGLAAGPGLEPLVSAGWDDAVCAHPSGARAPLAGHGRDVALAGDRVWTSTMDGSVTAWQVGDVVAWPQVEDRRSAQVVSGAVLCEIDGETADGVVAVFPAAEGEWFTDPYAAWQADTRSGKLRPVSGSLRCLNEGYGV